MVILLLSAVDLTTGAEAAAPEPAELANPTGSKAVSVLWDYTHGVYCPGYCYDLTDRYSALATLLTANGYALDTTRAGVDRINLSLYKIVVVNITCAWSSSYTAAEAESLRAFVERGGSLLIISENTGCPNGNLSQITSRFNFTVGLGDPQSCYSSFTTNPTYSSIFAGISPGNLCTDAPGAVSASSPSEAIGWMGSQVGAAGRCENGKGGVLLISDANHWDVNNLYDGTQNDLFALQVFAWLSNPPCKPTETEEAPAPAKNLAVSPNPAGEFLTVTLPNGINEAALYDISGSPVMRIRDGNNDIRPLRPGVYFLKAGQRVRRVIKL